MAEQGVITELITRLISSNNATLLTEINSLKEQLSTLTGASQVTEYVKQTINEAVVCTESLDVIKSIPEFTGNINSYVSWREAANNSLSLYAKGSRKYFAALTILRNKIVQDANDILTSHGTVLNFDAIIARLDFAYADKRPLHIIEQEMSILRQGHLSIVEFYNTVNEKLTLLTNKIIMTHGNNADITKELNDTNRRNALRVFITGLNQPLGNILFSLSPEDLPSALAKAFELESNNMRSQFALQFNRNQNSTSHNNNIQKMSKPNNTNNNNNNHNNQNNLRFPRRNENYQFPQNSNQKLPKVEPMDVDSSMHVVQRNGDFRNNQRQYNNQNQHPNFQPRHNNYYQNYQTEKRGHEGSRNSHQPVSKQQRINNISEDAFLDAGINSPSYSGRTDFPENH